jgi:hypothetical protein
MNNKNERQHYVSQVLLKRFKTTGKSLQCYQIQIGLWKPKSIERACSARGYNQLLVGSNMNNAIEDSFSKVETNLPETFKALEIAANHQSTDLPKEIYENLCSYCTFLLGTSLFAKPGAVVTFLAQINLELERGHYFLLRELGTPDEVILRFREGYFQGGRIIIESENVLQTVFRLQFERLLNSNYADFINSKWTISNSPLELPMSDIGLIGFRLDDIKAKHFILPISPILVLEGIFYFDQTKNSPKPVIKGLNLNSEEAEYRLDCICSSAVLELICPHKNFDVAGSRNRAKAKQIAFNKIVNPEQVLVAGLQNASIAYSLQMVSTEEYVKFVHSFIQPPNFAAK